MFGKSSFIISIVTVFILLSSSFAEGKPKSSDVKKSPALTVHKKPQPIDQTFNINNWGLGKADRKLLTEMKYKIDHLYQKSTSTNVKTLAIESNFQLIKRATNCSRLIIRAT